MKYLLSPSLLAALLGCVPAHAALERAAFVSLGASVMRIEVPRPRGGFSLGSGVAVDADKVVTNCHVTRDAREVHVVRHGVRWPARSQASDLSRDLCLLDVPGLGAPVVPLGRSAGLAIGQPVTALGYTGGIGMQSSAGEVVDLHRHDGARVIQSSNWFSSGASGGGLFDDDGRLVGILTFRLRGGDAHYFAAPAEWVSQMLAESQQGNFRRVLPLDSQPLPYWQASASAQPRFLKAAQLLRDARWGELESTASEWSRAEPDDAEPWYLLGAALERLDRPAEARSALECALRLEPSHAQARTRLSELATRESAAPGAARATAPACPVSPP